MVEKELKSIDKATQEIIEKAARDGCNVVFDRAETTKPCPIGSEGSCCNVCAMGPCRVPLPKNREETPEEKRKRRGVCGATSETIAARNLLRKIAAGSAAHSDHGRRVTHAFLTIAKGDTKDFVLKDDTGIIFLDYRQPSAIWEFFFGLLSASDYQGMEVAVEGWYRRAPVPYIEIKSIKWKDKITKSWLLFFYNLIGVLLIFIGFIWMLYQI